MFLNKKKKLFLCLGYQTSRYWYPKNNFIDNKKNHISSNAQFCLDRILGAYLEPITLISINWCS